MPTLWPLWSCLTICIGSCNWGLTINCPGACRVSNPSAPGNLACLCGKKDFTTTPFAKRKTCPPWRGMWLPIPCERVWSNASANIRIGTPFGSDPYHPEGRTPPVGATPSSRIASQTTKNRPGGGAPTKVSIPCRSDALVAMKASQTTTHRPGAGLLHGQKPNACLVASHMRRCDHTPPKIVNVDHKKTHEHLISCFPDHFVSQITFCNK